MVHIVTSKGDPVRRDCGYHSGATETCADFIEELINAMYLVTSERPWEGRTRDFGRINCAPSFNRVCQRVKMRIHDLGGVAMGA